MGEFKALFKCMIFLFVGILAATVVINVTVITVVLSSTSHSNVVVCPDHLLPPTSDFVRLSPSYDAAKNISFVEALAPRVSTDKIIILAYVDLPFVDMAANFYETSLKAHGLTQFMFATSGADCCAKLVQFGVPADACYVYRADSASGKASSFGSLDFIRKMNIRTDMILDALHAGYSVIHSDIDIVFPKDPLPALRSACPKCDVAALWDDFVYNAGFVYVRPTTLGTLLYKHMQDMSRAGTKLDDQQQFNQEIKKLRKEKTHIDVVKLNVKQFLCGKAYFEKAYRAFAGDNPCSECIVIHNNWIVSEEAKVYRFREHHMWLIDKDGYYSSNTTKYLTFDLPASLDDINETRALERAALANALAIGQILNRVVILPKFHCNSGKKNRVYCPLNDAVMLVNFDATFKNLYREHTFLQHSRVPKSVKESQSPVYFVNSSNAPQFKLDSGAAEGSLSNPKILRPQDVKQGASSDEILHWFGKNSDSVLRFHSLYEAFDKFTSASDQEQYSAKVSKGIIRGNYRQYTEKKHQNFIVW